ncbi:LOW QUALITY PROTEIN: zinc-binding alcohol dehydrogenase [Colletotrichum tofieldiae]|nr:LOW QUALITY PROTEIN: zinc-binding alcohol dehydrogenase [Colletotrichum tofieldiae]GKT77168.1 LOW QUALITY PROTEIN: zinc-binding alcohol dehydrogenase [Colletotrichum tofieldiae]GKT86444.1 LOW QUALITY PROTEIN: zinc-binding alcohol dehydrogenase [Colletotrichum tofieldiae]
MATANYTFEGWLGVDKSAAEGNLVWREFEPKPWEETDVDLKVTHSGICGTDLHTLRSGWYEAPYPICVGHEIVGVAVRVGSEAEGNIKVGDRVSEPRPTLASVGLARFVFKLDERLDSASVAPMLCGGITVYSPLKLNGCGPGKTVGVIGIGGLGHCALLFAKALGAHKVVGISRSGSKREEVLRMGADEHIATSEQLDWAKAYSGSFDMVINTVGTNKVPFGEYLNLVGVDGTFIQVGLPDDGSFEVNPMLLVSRRIKLTGSSIGSRKEIREMLDLAAAKSIKLWVQERPMSEANQGILDFEAGKARYRYVLTL